MNNLSIAGICAFLFTLNFSAPAQTFRLHTGLSLAGMVLDTDQKSKLSSGLLLGVTGEFTASHYLSLETGLCRSPKGFKLITIEEVSGETRKDKYLFTPNYLDLFVNAKGSFDSGSLRIFCTAGPYLGIGIGGKEKTISYTDGDKVSTSYRDLSWGSGEENDIRRYDFGFSLGAGAELRAIQFRIFYQVGLPDVSPSEESWTELKTRMIGFMMGFRFAGS